MLFIFLERSPLFVVWPGSVSCQSLYYQGLFGAGDAMLGEQACCEGNDVSMIGPDLILYLRTRMSNHCLSMHAPVKTSFVSSQQVSAY